MAMGRVVAVLCAALLISACRGGDGNGDGGVTSPPTIPAPSPTPNPAPTPDPEPTPEPTPDPTPEPTPPPANDQKTPVPTDIGTPIGAPISKVIGAAGGELATHDGAIAVIVPAGAFAKDETVTIQEITNEAHGGKGRAFRISPEGLNTPVPMTVRFSYTDADLQGTTLEALDIAYQQASGTWRVYSQPTIDTTNKTLAVQTRHFSDWSRVLGVQLVPNTARVKIGDSLQLRVMYCERETVDEDGEIVIPMPDDLIACETSPLNAFNTREWSVNGVEGGSASTGTIVPDADRWAGKATYTAPATKPTPNVVAVSARFNSLLDDSMHLLVANLTIEEELSCATFRSMNTLSAELSFDSINFVAVAEHRRHTGKHSGKLIGTLHKVETGPANFGFWVTYLSPLAGGHVSINDQYQYTPPHDGGYTGTVVANGAPYDDITAPSYIGLKVNYDTCTFDLFGSFIVNGTITHDGQVSNGLIGVGGLTLFGMTMSPEQAANATLEGSLAVNARDDGHEEITGYYPWEDVSTTWVVTGGTTARWKITP